MKRQKGVRPGDKILQGFFSCNTFKDVGNFLPPFHLLLLTLVCLVNAVNMVFTVKNKCSQAFALPVGQEVRSELVETLTELYRDWDKKEESEKYSAFLVPLRKYCYFCFVLVFCLVFFFSIYHVLLLLQHLCERQ